MMYFGQHNDPAYLRQQREEKYQRDFYDQRQPWQKEWVHCEFHTNIDCMRRLEWPECLPGIPRVGMLIEPLGDGFGPKHIKIPLLITSVLFKNGWYFDIWLGPEPNKSIIDIIEAVRVATEPPNEQ